MQVYPAIKAKMGDWDYYIVRMKTKEIANEINLAHDFYEDNTLSDAIQRNLDEGRVKRQIVSYLVNRDDRFFSSIVVASLGGNPTWYPVVMDTTVVPEVFANAQSMRDSFGVLSFEGDPKYYALDGQHRVAAIKSLVKRDVDVEPPPDFDRDLVSVIVIPREEQEGLSDNRWLQRYRRLFSSLNRYAKPTDRDTNIIMDEDDLFAILTRRLITDHNFFRAPGRQKESFKVKTKGKNLLGQDRHFTTLQTLYLINERLLETRSRLVAGTAPRNKQISPSEEEIEDYYNELSNYWNAILETIPSLRNNPSEMRVTKQDDADDKQGENHFLFRPIGQELFAGLVRNLLDDAFPDEGYATVDQMAQALNHLTKISWELHDTPWRHLILVKNINNRWTIRSEERKKVLDFACRLLRWFVNLDQLDEFQIDDLRSDWTDLLYGGLGNVEIDEMWSEIRKMRMEILKD